MPGLFLMAEFCKVVTVTSVNWVIFRLRERASFVIVVTEAV